MLLQKRDTLVRNRSLAITSVPLQRYRPIDRLFINIDENSHSVWTVERLESRTLYTENIGELG
jgi:hypothetical protein